MPGQHSSSPVEPRATVAVRRHQFRHRQSHFAEALAHKAIDAGMRVAWFTLETLTAVIGRAAVDGTTAKAIAKITRCDLIAVDDIGMLPAGQAAAQALYRLGHGGHQRRALILTLNLHPRRLDT